ncbi:D-arginine dehydrogenase [Humitalea rosea]|uniref:D-arginine dehydrogenase n=1 Tax=Humitalea rosea TaxID=990373 RepID=A0A2W7IG11_9PROT|nr:FAD-binding oxidoreductase [Humitalea rosea]PZW45673.1 D-arginine dehydrogenase [Humitalea rosea]
MDSHRFDVIIVGAGMAGATVAAQLAGDLRVAIVEQEETAGYHTTGRSAAIWMLNYGPPDVRAMTGASRGFFEAPPEGFAEVPLMQRRAVVHLAPPGEEAELALKIAASEGTIQEISVADVVAMAPGLRPDYAVAAAIEPESFDMDVAALHQGFLRMVRANKGEIALRARAGRIWKQGEMWRVETSQGETLGAPILINAAGAWGDEIATLAGLRPLGLQPKRRTAIVLDPGGHDVAEWPLLGDVAHTWYARPEARRKLMVSPADETDSEPTDAQPDELDIAITVDRFQQAFNIEVRRVEHSWAGLRTFAPDRSFVLGEDTDHRGFFWAVGQGGYGIQTAPAAGRLLAGLVLGAVPEDLKHIVPMVDPMRFRG